MNRIVKFSAGYAIYSLIFSVSILLIKPELMFSLSWANLAMLVLGVFVTIYLGRFFLRGAEDSYLSYGAAVKELFIGIVIATLLSTTVIASIFSNNESLKMKYKDSTIETTIATTKWGMSLGGASDATIEEAVSDIMDQIESGELELAPYPYSWARIPFNFGISLIGGILLSLIAARWVRENEEANFS